MSEWALELNNISYSVDRQRIISDISLKIKPGEFLTVIGPNGAGKTTLLRCITRFLKPDSGSIILFGKDSHRISQKQFAQITAYVPQQTAVSFPYTVEDFVTMGRYPYQSLFGSADPDQHEIIESALKETCISHLRYHLLPTLSGGEMQKVMIASCLVQTPRILLLDEITTHLDPKYQQDLTVILHKLNRDNGMTIVSVTHDINFALSLSHKILALVDGKILFFGDTSGLTTRILSEIFHIEFSVITPSRSKKQIIFPAWSADDEPEQ